MQSKESGFTIVELLIVIVVVGILAAIFVVAFGSVRTRAQDSAIKVDLQSLVKQIRAYEVENGELPKAASSDQSNRSVPNLVLKVSKQSYNTNQINLYYCQGNRSGSPSFTLTARSWSGNLFVYTPEAGTTQATGGNEPSNCRAGYDGDIYTIAQGYHPLESLKWADWIE